MRSRNALVLWSAVAAVAAAAAAGRTPTQISVTPRIYVYDDVFTLDEALRLRARAEPTLTEAGTMNFQGEQHGPKARKARDATVTGVHPVAGQGNDDDSDDDVVRMFRRRMALAALVPEEHGEVLQVTRYTKGQKYELHFDSSMHAGRLVTVLAFLSEPKEGGELAFPWADRGELVDVNPPGVRGRGRHLSELRGVTTEPPAGPLCTNTSQSLLLAPRVGRIVVWFNHDPMLRRETFAAMHAGCPVKSGDAKWIAQLWVKWHIPLYEPNLLAESFQEMGIDWKRVETYGS